MVDLPRRDEHRGEGEDADYPERRNEAVTGAEPLAEDGCQAEREHGGDAQQRVDPGDAIRIFVQ